MKTYKLIFGVATALLGITSSLVAQPVETPPATEATPAVGNSNEEGIRLNFRGVPLETVLNYLSEAAGFAIVLDTEVTGDVNVWSHKALTSEEAVDLLNSILIEKGYTAIRNGRILKIVKRDDAHKRDLPVVTGSNPDLIPRNDAMVTQVIAVRYADALKLIEDLQPLLPEHATLTANESSNALVLTDTQANIRRMAQIVRALDTSISGISVIRVFPLRYSDATELATVIKDLFAEGTSSSGRSGRSSGGGPGSFFDRFRRGGGDDGGGRGGSNRGGRSSSGDSEARAAASRVVAVADERTNSLVVSAPDEYMPTIEQLVVEIDTNVADITELRVFPLQFADATEMAQILTDLFADTDETSDQQRGGFRFGGGDRGGSRGNNNDTSARVLRQARVVAVGDPRTNSVIISAAGEMMGQIGKMIDQLDSDSSKKQKVFVYSLEHADAESVAAILRGMFETQTTGSGANANQNESVLNNRARTGASINTGTGGGGGAGGQGLR